MSLGSNGVDRVRSLQKKFRCDFAARNFALIAPIQTVLYRASCSNKTIQNAPKHYETHRYMNLGFNGGGSGAFVAKHSDAISRHELVH